MPPKLLLNREAVPKKDKNKHALKKREKEKEKEKAPVKNDDEKEKEKEKRKQEAVPIEPDEEVGEEALAKVAPAWRPALIDLVSLETWLQRKADGQLTKKDCQACPKTEHEQRHKKGLCPGCYQRSGRGNDATHNARCVIYSELKELKGVSAIMLHFAADAACTLCWRHHHLLPTD